MPTHLYQLSEQQTESTAGNNMEKKGYEAEWKSVSNVTLSILPSHHTSCTSIQIYLRII